MSHITMTDLIYSLRMAAAHPEAHSPAQQSYFSEVKKNSVLINCGTACCVAGDLMLQEYVNNNASAREIDKILSPDFTSPCPDDWAKAALGLSEVEATLAFDSNTHHEIHRLLANLLAAGLRLPDTDRVSLPTDGTYTEFKWAYLTDEDRYLDLQETLDWMRSIAQ